ncbi:hypothetical protein O1611_g7091 [Lasiodiplodia mahajangana]|uniref:Uncharacterized protein n=1 Tax=Lasiodiplodia mahajangana TaxID=1108764 RepID=A0ACC2JG99_9PEZI|nr:hypothetical protein O1611_g7091 [Lasiodiplodia mahajangana]
MAHGKHKTKKGKQNPTKENRMNHLYQEYQILREQRGQLGETIAALEAQRQNDNTSQVAYDKKLYKQLPSAYESRATVETQLRTKWAEYEAVAAEPESSGDESNNSTS